MKDKIKQLIVYIVALAILVPLGFVTKIFSLQDLKEITFDISKLWKVLVMAFVVLVIENLIAMILGMIQPKQHRARSVLS
ncbi:MAG: hypothetical protein J5528_02770, partial [Firmicutes bacterium]|nr:hypothetical protein [Bacillota bacterium]